MTTSSNVQYINVDVTVNKDADVRMSAKFPFLQAISNDIYKRVNKMKRKAQPIARNISNAAQQYQTEGIISLDAVFTGRLRDSITVYSGGGGTSAHYRVRTNIHDQYPKRVVNGRKPVTVKRAKFLRFWLEPGGDPVFAKKVRRAKAKNYMALADKRTTPRISQVVEREIKNVFG